MALLVGGLFLFIGIHLLREIGIRDFAVERLGNRFYPLAHTLISLTGLVLIVLGKSAAPFIQVYEPIYGLQRVSHILMLPAFVLVVAGSLPVSHLRKHIVHPMLLGTIIWGGAHLWANGDLASVLLFGSIAIWAMIKFISLLKAKGAPDSDAWFMWDVVAVVSGFCLYGLVLIYHGQLFGIGLALV